MIEANTSYKQNGVPVPIPSGSYGIARLTVHQYEYPKGHPCHMNDNRTIRIMVFEPGRAPYTTMLEDSLEHRQELVGGDIQCIPLPCETVLCCNASGKLTGLPENRQYGPDTLHGTFFLYGDTPEGRGVSLTDEQIAMYQEYFPQPVPTAVSFEVRSAADMKEFMNLMFGKHRCTRGTNEIK